MDKTENIKREKFSKLFAALTVVSEKGNLDFSEWLKLEEYRLKLDDIKERDKKLFKNIMDTTGYTKYAVKAERLVMKNTKRYAHSDEDISTIESFKKKSKEFDESIIEIPFFRISKSLLDDFPEEILFVRKDLLPIIDLTENTVKPKK